MLNHTELEEYEAKYARESLEQNQRARASIQQEDEKMSGSPTAEPGLLVEELFIPEVVFYQTPQSLFLLSQYQRTTTTY